MKNLVATRQLSIYLILTSLIFSAAMMRPNLTTLALALPFNTLILILLRWVAHREGETK